MLVAVSSVVFLVPLIVGIVPHTVPLTFAIRVACAVEACNK